MSAESDETTRSSARQKNFLPRFCGIRAVFTTVVLAELLAIILVLGWGGSLDQMIDRLSLLSLYVQWIALCSAALLCVLSPVTRTLSNRIAGIIAYAVILVTTLAVSEAAYAWLDRIRPIHGLSIDDRWQFLLRGLGVSGIVAALMLRYLYLQHLWRCQVLAESDARLLALQARIRPHFLFNSMNTIASLTRTRPKDAEEIVHDLADLFRVGLSEAGVASTLGKELDLARG